jgi:hypothetical protein
MRGRLVTSIAAALLLLVTLIPLSAQMPPPPFIMTAFVVNMTNVSIPRGNAGTLQIRINSFSPQGTRQRLIQTMIEKGQDALLKALQKEPSRGRISFPGWQGPDPQNYRLGWDLRYVAHTQLPDGGDRLVIATDRQMSMWEVQNQPRTVDYPFTLFEIHIPKEGKGEGRGFGATKIKFDKKKNQIELEQWSAGDLRLNEITIEAKKK